VWLSGGDQSRLVAAYRGTQVERALQGVLARGGVIGGTSAGAAVMSPLMIIRGNPSAQVGPGFGWLPGLVVDTHFGRRHRQPRLLGVVTTHPGFLGLGIDERTAVVVRGRSMEVLGEASAELCMPQGGARGASWRTLRPGDHADLADVGKGYVALTRGNP
jgi:cyanophycinase